MKGLLKVSLNGERQTFLSELFIWEKKLNQQGGVDGNWIKLPLKNMRFQRRYNLGPLWTTTPSMPFIEGVVYSGYFGFFSSAVNSVTVHCRAMESDRQKQEGWGRIKWKELVGWSRRHLWSAEKLNPLIPRPLLLPSSFCFLRPSEDIAAIFFQR